MAKTAWNTENCQQQPHKFHDVCSDKDPTSFDTKPEPGKHEH